MDTSTEIHPIELLNEQSLGFPLLEKLNLKQNGEELHLAVVGILGDENSGKSFLMNLVAEHLRCEELKIGGWMSNLTKTKTKLSGFQMKNSNNCTNSNEGLYMWPKPFILKNPGQNGDVAVILLDLNMKNVTPRMQLTMCLLCSTIIYNTSSNNVHNVWEMIRAIKQKPIEVRCEETTTKLQNLLFQQLVVVFRDQEKKFGEDKSLNHLKNILRQSKHFQIADGLDSDGIPNVDCFLLPKPKQVPVNEEGYLDLDKGYSQHVQLLATKTLTIDDLPLKSWNSSSLMNFKQFFAFVNSIFTLPLLQEFGQSCVESNPEEQMETNENSFLPDDDVVMEDLENNIQCKEFNGPVEDSKPRPQHLALSKVNKADYADDEDDTSLHKTCQSVDTTTNETSQEKNIPSSSAVVVNGKPVRENEIILTNEEIENRISQFEQNIAKKANRICNSGRYNTEQLQNEFRRIFEKSKMEFDEIATTSIQNPVRWQQQFENRIAQVLENILKEGNERESRGQNMEMSPAPAASIQIDITTVIRNQFKFYNEAMQKSSENSATKQTLKKTHEHLVDIITKELLRVCKDENIRMDQVLSSIMPQIEEAYKSFQNRIGTEGDFTHHTQTTIETFLDKCFIQEFKNSLGFGLFLKTDAKEIVTSWIKISADEIVTAAPQVSHEKIQRTINKPSATEKYLQAIEYLQKAIKFYTFEMNKKQSMYNFLSPEQINKFHADATKKLLQVDNAEHHQEILDIGLEVVKEQYQALNAEIIHNEQNAFNEVVIPQIKSQYEAEMNYFTQKKMTSTQITEAQENLRDQFKAAIIKACSYKDPNIPLLENCFEKMNKELDEQLQSHIRSNQSKKDQAQNKIQEAVRTRHADYTANMTKKINGKILVPAELENLHKSCFKETTVVLKIDIRNIDDTEDPQAYTNKLQLKIENDFKVFTEQNNKALKKQMEDERNTRYAHWVKEPYPNPVDATFREAKPPKPEPSSPIIAIEFGIHKIRSGVTINGKFTSIPSTLNQTEFPNLVAINKQGQILVGDEVLYKPDEIDQTFNPGELMTLSSDQLKVHHSKKFHFQGSDVFARKEFLCSLILSRIKSNAETFLNKRLSRVVITVPLWYSSSQRQATKDAAIIAGFDSANIINDITAAALAYANKTMNNRFHNFLIINTIGGNVDVALYEIVSKKAKMLKCAGFLHGSHLGEPGWLKKVCQYFWKGTNSENEDEIEAVKKLVDHCVKNHYYIQASTVLFDGNIACNSKYREALQKIAAKDGREFVNMPEGVLIGASIFGHFLEDKYDGRSKTSKSELLPYKIEFYKPKSQTNGTIFGRHLQVLSTGLKQDVTFEENDKFTKEILEIGNTNNSIQAGYLDVFVPARDGVKREVAITACISSEGILSFTARYKYDRHNTIDVLWRSGNLSQDEIVNYASLISSYYPSPEQKTRLECDKGNLRKLATLLLKNVHHVEGGYGREQILNATKASISTADNPYTKLEDIEERVNDLAKLKSKYCPNL